MEAAILYTLQANVDPSHQDWLSKDYYVGAKGKEDKWRMALTQCRAHGCQTEGPPVNPWHI